MYHERPQKSGKLAHETIDKQIYSTEKKWLQGIDVYSQQYGICGKIDLFNSDTGALVERKNKIKQIYDGYRYQVYAQMFCLREMGYEVKSIFLHSLSDNKRYEIPIPTLSEEQEFAEIIQQMKTYKITDPISPNPNKCAQCIYRELCDAYKP